MNILEPKNLIINVCAGKEPIEIIERVIQHLNALGNSKRDIYKFLLSIQLEIKQDPRTMRNQILASEFSDLLKNFSSGDLLNLTPERDN